MSYIYYFKPDGSLATMSATHNADGSLRPSGSSSTYSAYSSAGSVGRKVSTGYVAKDVSSKKSKKKNNKTAKIAGTTVKKAVSTSSENDVDRLLNSWKESFPNVSLKSLKKARRKFSIPSVQSYFERKLQEYCNAGYLSIQAASTNVTNSQPLHPVRQIIQKVSVPTVAKGKIISTKEVDELVCHLTSDGKIPSMSLIEAEKERMVSFTLRDYFVRRIEAAKIKPKEEYNPIRRTSVVKSHIVVSNSSKKSSIHTKADIDNLVRTWVKCNGGVSEKTLKKTKSKISDLILLEYLDMKVKEIRKVKSSSSKKTKVKTKKSSPQRLSTSRNDVPEYMQSSNSISHTGGRKPKYGYARDIFGRIQERDHYIEGRPVNKYDSSSSLYDSEDDHDSTYECGYDFD